MRVRSRHSSKRLKTIRVALVSLLIIGIGMSLPSVFSGVAAMVMVPVHGVNQWLEHSSSLIPTFFRDRRSLEQQIKDLENLVSISERTSLTQQRLWEENNRLRGLLGAAGDQRLLAAVIARPNEIPYDLLQIDRGSDHGVEIGAPVFVGRDEVIGLVVHVAATYSFVEMLTTPGFETPVFISGPNVIVTMEGRGGGVARVRVPQGVPLAVGDLVYLPSVEPGVFGRLSYIENEPTQPEQYGYISPNVPLSGVYQVAVGKQSQIAQSVVVVDERVRMLIEASLLRSTLVAEELEATSTPELPEAEVVPLD